MDTKTKHPRNAPNGRPAGAASQDRTPDPSRNPGPRGNPAVEPGETEKGRDKLNRVLGW